MHNIDIKIIVISWRLKIIYPVFNSSIAYNDINDNLTLSSQYLIYSTSLFR